MKSYLVIESIKKANDFYSIQMLMCTEEFAFALSRMTTEEKLNFFKEIGIEDSVSKELFATILCSVAKSLNYSWEDKENMLTFIKWLERLSYVFPKDFYNFANRVQVHSENENIIFEALRNAIYLEACEEWITFLIAMLSRTQLAIFNSEILKEDVDLSKYLSAKDKVLEFYKKIR